VLHPPVESGQFRSRKFVHVINRHAMVGSMGRIGAAGDNAAMESFFSLLQKNVLDRRPWATREDLRIAIVRWIERTYHRRRRQVGLGRLTPVEYELIIRQPPPKRPNRNCHPFVQRTPDVGGGPGVRPTSHGWTATSQTTSGFTLDQARRQSGADL
jgi:putative transposase